MPSKTAQLARVRDSNRAHVVTVVCCCTSHFQLNAFVICTQPLLSVHFHLLTQTRGVARRSNMNPSSLTDMGCSQVEKKT